jgi:hypothetical protein
MGSQVGAASGLVYVRPVHGDTFGAGWWILTACAIPEAAV